MVCGADAAAEPGRPAGDGQRSAGDPAGLAAGPDPSDPGPGRPDAAGAEERRALLFIVFLLRTCCYLSCYFKTRSCDGLLITPQPWSSISIFLHC